MIMSADDENPDQAPGSLIAHKIWIMVPGPRVELGLSCENQILSLARLPVPPSGHPIPVI